MHDSALRIGKAFLSSYVEARAGGDIAILDVGGLNVNGTLRSVADSQWRYVSVDISPGDGVDIVLDDPYTLPFPDESFDVALSTSCFEHDAMFWLTFLEMSRVTKEGGFVYLNAPSNGPVHRYPIDAWRFYPDASLALLKWSDRSGMPMTLCESFVANSEKDGWSDFVAIFKKGVFTDLKGPMIHKKTSCSHVREHGYGSNYSANQEDTQKTDHIGPKRHRLRRLGNLLTRLRGHRLQRPN